MKVLYTFEPELTEPNEHYAIFTVQGSSPEPYTITVNFNPLTISCTCQAGIMGIPCKHRIHILKGYCENLLIAPQNYNEVLSAAHESAHNAGILDVLDEYESLKKNTKTVNEKVEKLFKNYLKEVIAQALQKSTEKKVKKASMALDTGIQDCVNAAAEAEELLQALRTLFVRPGRGSTAEAIAAEAAAD